MKSLLKSDRKKLKLYGTFVVFGSPNAVISVGTVKYLLETDKTPKTLCLTCRLSDGLSQFFSTENSMNHEIST